MVTMNELNLATVKEAMKRYRVSRTTLMKIAKESKALRKIGKSVRIDIDVMDQYIKKDR